MVLFLCAYIRSYLVEFILSTKFGQICNCDHIWSNLHLRLDTVAFIFSTNSGRIYDFDQIWSNSYLRPDTVAFIFSTKFGRNYISTENGRHVLKKFKFKSAAIFPPTKYFQPEVIFDQNHDENKMEGPVECTRRKQLFFDRLFSTGFIFDHIRSN